MKRAADAQLTRDTAEEEDSGSVSLTSIASLALLHRSFTII
jgi:hypothetical protein